ncbi:unnamed protein product [Schistosoma turkestanicum]|nr:unnamed protein product [Schistosoma turkestanicum]
MNTYSLLVLICTIITIHLQTTTTFGRHTELVDDTDLWQKYSNDYDYYDNNNNNYPMNYAKQLSAYQHQNKRGLRNMRMGKRSLMYAHHKNNVDGLLDQRTY